MRASIYCGAVLVLLAFPALAQDKATTIQPNHLTTEAREKPPLALTDKQRAAIQDALVTQHTEQKTPDNFEAKVGGTIAIKLKIDVMPAPLINQEPVLKQYGYAKLEKELLVIDPMNSKVVAVIPRKFPQDDAKKPNAPSGQSGDPASSGDEAEHNKKE